MAFAPGVDESFELCNITAQGEDGWALIARYGDVNHTGPVGKNTPVVQRFQRADADAIVEDFKRGAGRIRRAVVGVPLLNGHPDAMGLEHIFSDKTVYGAFSTIEARDDGLYGRPVVTNTGGRLIEDGKDRLSPNWDCIAGGTHANGRAILRPFRLKSVGLVRSSAIPNPSLLNSAPPTPPMKTSLLKLLAALGFAVPADSSDEQIVTLTNSATADCEALPPELRAKAPTVAKAAIALHAELGTVTGRLTALDAENVTLVNSKTQLEGEKATLATGKATAEAEATALKTKLDASRKEASTFLVNCAVEDGRVSAAQRDATVTTLVNAADFAAEVGKLGALPRKLKTTSGLGNLKQAASGGAPSAIIELVNARMEKTGEDYSTAFANIQGSPEGAELFGTLKSPEVKTTAKA